MTKRKRTHRQTIMLMDIQRKLKIEQHEPREYKGVSRIW